MQNEKKRTNGRPGELLQLVLGGAGILVALNFCYLVVMTLLFMLPVGDRVKQNVAGSLHTWKDGLETEAPVFDDNRILWNDTSSEILLVNCAVTETGNPLRRGIALFYKQAPITGEIPPVQSYRNLEAALSDNPDAGVTTETYERYWYLLAGAVRLLFSFLTIGEIRWLLYVCGALLSLWLFLRVFMLLGVRGVFPLTLAFLSRVLILQTAMSMTAMDVYTACAAMIALTYLHGKSWFRDYRPLFYMVTGSVTFAIGPFIAPLLTLGMTLVLDLQLTGERDGSRQAWGRLFTCSLAWAAGYALTMLCKMLVSLFAVGSAEAADVAAGYMGADAGSGLAGRLDILKNCLYRLMMPVQATAVVLVIFAVILGWQLKKHGMEKPQGLLLTLAVALYPVVWVLLVSEHSRHDYAVNIFAVTVYGLASICAGFVKKQDSSNGPGEETPGRNDT